MGEKFIENLSEDPKEEILTEKEKISRRGFLKATAKVAAGVAVGSFFESQASGVESKKTWDDLIKEFYEKNGIKIEVYENVNCLLGSRYFSTEKRGTEFGATKIIAKKDKVEKEFFIIKDQLSRKFNIFGDLINSETISTAGKVFMDTEVKDSLEFLKFLENQFNTIEASGKNKYFEAFESSKAMFESLKLKIIPDNQADRFFIQDIDDNSQYPQNLAVIEISNREVKLSTLPMKKNTPTAPITRFDIKEGVGNDWIFQEIWRNLNSRNFECKSLERIRRMKGGIISSISHMISDREDRNCEAMLCSDKDGNFISSVAIFDRKTGRLKGTIEIGGSDIYWENYQIYVYNTKSQLIAKYDKVESSEFQDFVNKL